MRPVPIGVILGVFAFVIVSSITAVVVTFILTNEKAIRVSIGTLVDNVMIRNVQVALRYVSYFETSVYQTVTAVRVMNLTALDLSLRHASIGDLNASTASSWAVAIEPMWTVLSLTGFPSEDVLATFELWAPVNLPPSAPGYVPEPVRWDGAGCVALSRNCFLYNSTLNRTMSTPANHDYSVFYTDNATVTAGTPSFLQYTSDFIDQTFTNVLTQPSSLGQWSPLYITPAYAVSSAQCNGVPVLKYLIFFVCFEYTQLLDKRFSCIHGVGSMLAADIFGNINTTSLQSASNVSMHSLKEVDGVNGSCKLNDEAQAVVDVYLATCAEDERNGEFITGTAGTTQMLSLGSNFAGGPVDVPSRSIITYTYCRPRAYSSADQVTGSCLLNTEKGLSFVFVDETSRTLFFGAADRSKEVCVVLGCVVVVGTFLMCTFFWLITTRPIRWICRGMQRAKTLASSDKDTLEHARWYTMIYEVSMLYTAYLELRQALKELKAYVPQGLFVAPSDSSILRPDAFMANLLGLDGYATEDDEINVDFANPDDDEDGEDDEDVADIFGTDGRDADQPHLVPRRSRGAATTVPPSDTLVTGVKQAANDAIAADSIYRYDRGATDGGAQAQEMREMSEAGQSLSQGTGGSTVFSDPCLHRRKPQSVHPLQKPPTAAIMAATTTTTSTTRTNAHRGAAADEMTPTMRVSLGTMPLGARDSKDDEANGIVTIFGTSESQPSTPVPLAPAGDLSGPPHGLSSQPAFWSGVPALEGSVSAAAPGQIGTGTGTTSAWMTSHVPHQGEIVTVMPLHSGSGIGSIVTQVNGGGATQSHEVRRAFAGPSLTVAPAACAGREARDGTTTAVPVCNTAARAPPERPRQPTGAVPGAAATISSTGRSMEVDASALQLDLTRTTAVNHFRPVTCSFVFIAFAFRFVDAASLERDVSRVMDVVVRCVLRLGGVLEVFRPDVIAVSFGAQSTQSQHVQRAITCAASIAKLSPARTAARMRVLVDSGAYFVGSCGTQERTSRVIFGDRFGFALDLLKHDMLLGRVLLTDRVAMCLPAGAVTPVDYVIPLRNRTQGTQLFQLLNPKRARDPAYRQGARQFRAAFMHALEGRFDETLRVLDRGGLHDPELADHLARAMRYLMASRPVRPRYCRFQLTEFELLGVSPHDRALKYQYDRLSLEQINPEQSAPSIHFGFGDSVATSVDANLMSAAIFSGPQVNESASGDVTSPQPPPQPPSQPPPPHASYARAVSTGTYQVTDGKGVSVSGQEEELADVRRDGVRQTPSALTAVTPDAPQSSRAERAAGTDAPSADVENGAARSHAYASSPIAHERIDTESYQAEHLTLQGSHHNETLGISGGLPDDDDPAVLDGHPPLVFKDHQGILWHRMPKAIGAGAFAEVYMVVSNAGTLMAAKCIRLTSSHINLEDVVAEVNIACGLFNDFIVNYTGWAHTCGYLFLLMEYMPGGTLQKLISGFPRGMPVQLARHYAADALKGLVYLHRHNVIHADLKPQNVLLAVDGGCKISDFGSSLTRGRALQITGDVFQLRGTPFYMSPEVASGAAPSMRSDMWSYGVCLYEVLTGALPWKLKKSVPRGATRAGAADEGEPPMREHRGAAPSEANALDAASPIHAPLSALSTAAASKGATGTPAASVAERREAFSSPAPDRDARPVTRPTVVNAPSARDGFSATSIGDESKLSVNTSAASVTPGPHAGRGAASLAAVLPSVATTTAKTHVNQNGSAGQSESPAHAPGSQSTTTESNGPSAISLAGGVTGAEVESDPVEDSDQGVMSEVWVDLPPLSDARFVQGIITGEIAPRVLATTLPSQEAYHLIVSCLRYNFRERPTAMELINHPFFFV